MVELGVADPYVGYCVVQAVQARDWYAEAKLADKAAVEAKEAEHAARVAEMQAAGRTGMIPGG